MRFLNTQVKPWRVGILFLMLSMVIVGGWIIFGIITEPPFNELRLGMSTAEVESIMGTPDSTFNSGDSAKWWYHVRHMGNEYDTVFVFNNGHLAGCDGKGPLIEQ